jgi:hypothetical protein
VRRKKVFASLFSYSKRRNLCFSLSTASATSENVEQFMSTSADALITDAIRAFRSETFSPFFLIAREFRRFNWLL